MTVHPLAAPGRVPVPEYDGSAAAAPTPAQATSVSIPMRDGVNLAAHVYLPALAEHQSVPTVLSRLPYDKGGRYTFWDKIADRFTAHGFAVVVQDVRGKFESEGELFPFRNEPADGYDTLEWVVEQPWSNGSVGMYGDSYYGFTQWAAVSTKHPALKAFVPCVTGSDLFLYAHPDAMPRLPMREWLAHTWGHEFLSYDPYSSSIPEPAYHAPEGHAEVEQTIRLVSEAIADGSLLEATFPDGWPAETLEIPALHVSGWYDNCLEAQLRDWQRASGSPAAAHQYLRLGSTDHEAFPWRELGVPLENHEEDDDATHQFLDGAMVDVLSFLDHYLNDRGGRWSAPTVKFATTNGLDQVADRWPPANVRPVDVVLTELAASASDRGRLSGLTDVVQPVETESVTWVHDPSFPVPFLPESEFGQCADLPDESYLHARPDVLVFDSIPVGTPVDLCGTVNFDGLVDADGGSTHVVVRLLDLYPTGEARAICYGAVVADTSSGPIGVQVPMVATSYRMRPGHALRLVVSTSCFPLYAVHPGHDGDVWDLADAKATKQTLLSSADRRATVRLSVR